MQFSSIESPNPVPLGPGRHASPTDGACLMELASLLAGEPWSDHPACVHPVLAAVARVVNDKVGVEGRDRLAPLVPVMIGTATADAGSSARVVLLCTSAALAQAGVRGHVDICCEVESVRRAAKRALMSSRWLARIYRRRAASHATLALAAMAGSGPTDRVTLCELLESCVSACRAEPANRSLSRPIAAA